MPRATSWISLCLLLPLFLLSFQTTAFASSYEGLSEADSTELTDQLLTQLDDSLLIGVARFQFLFEQHQHQNTDSLKYVIQSGEGRVWMDWALTSNPRYGMSGEQWISLADLFAWLDQFDFEGAYDKQLNCLKWAGVYPETEFLAISRLHTEYHLAGFSPGIISTGGHLVQLNRKRALEAGIARNIAQAWYFVGGYDEALDWLKKHIKAHPKDLRAKDLKKQIRARKKSAAKELK
jgi:hypothetical protein